MKILQDSFIRCFPGSELLPICLVALCSQQGILTALTARRNHNY